MQNDIARSRSTRKKLRNITWILSTMLDAANGQQSLEPGLASQLIADSYVCLPAGSSSYINGKIHPPEFGVPNRPPDLLNSGDLHSPKCMAVWSITYLLAMEQIQVGLIQQMH